MIQPSMLKTLVSGFLISLLAVGAVAEELLESELSAREFRRAGLDKLSAEELAFLNERLGRQAPTEQTFGQEQVERESTRPQRGVAIESTIRGEFSGWRGKTMFVLENGQVWQQRVGGRYRYTADSPAVTISRERFGYYLVVNATGRKVGVKRIR